MRVYLHGLYKKLGVGNKTSAVIWYFDRLKEEGVPSAALPAVARRSPRGGVVRRHRAAARPAVRAGRDEHVPGRLRPGVGGGQPPEGRGGGPEGGPPPAAVAPAVGGHAQGRLRLREAPLRRGPGAAGARRLAARLRAARLHAAHRRVHARGRPRHGPDRAPQEGPPRHFPPRTSRSPSRFATRSTPAPRRGLAALHRLAVENSVEAVPAPRRDGVALLGLPGAQGPRPRAADGERHPRRGGVRPPAAARHGGAPALSRRASAPTYRCRGLAARGKVPRRACGSNPTEPARRWRAPDAASPRPLRRRSPPPASSSSQSSRVRIAGHRDFAAGVGGCGSRRCGACARSILMVSIWIPFVFGSE